MQFILFVCTGNICRSPTAEGVMRRKLEQAGLASKVHVDSAGTHGYHVGEFPDRRSVTAAKRRGYDIASLRARQVEAEDFRRFDHILALDNSHFRTLTAMIPDNSVAKLAMFYDRDIPDPYYGSAKDFEHALDLIELGCDALVNKLKHPL